MGQEEIYGWIPLSLFSPMSYGNLALISRLFQKLSVPSSEAFRESGRGYPSFVDREGPAIGIA